MKVRQSNIIIMVAVFGVAVAISQAQEKEKPNQENGLPKGIQWHGVLADGMAEAKSTNRPIMLLSAAPQCAGVPGMW